MSAVPPSAELSTRSTGLAKRSTNLATRSQALDKASIISIAKKSLLASSSADAAVHVAADGDEIPWHGVETADEIIDDLVSSASDGLGTAEAKRRLDDFGPNALTEVEKPSFLRKLWNQLNNVLIFVLAAAAIVEGALQSWAEFGLVLGVIAINTAIGLIQEGKAEKAAEALKAMLSANAQVLRDGEVTTIPADELVPGDIVLLKSGDKIPADMRLIEATNLQVQEAMLTGESVPVSKHLKPAPPEASLGDRRCMAYSATSVVSGQGKAIVVGTGDSAEIGQINKMVNTVANVKSNLLYQLEILGRWLCIMVAVIALVSFLLALLHVGLDFKGAFESAVSIAVAIIPEGLPAVVTIVLAVGTTVMAKNNAIIRQLPAVETLGSLNVICSDKTGTLTKNEMTAVNIRTAANLYQVTGVGYAPVGQIVLDDSADQPLSDVQKSGIQQLLQGAVLCNDSSLSRSNVEVAIDMEGHSHHGGKARGASFTRNKPVATPKVVYQPQGAPTEVALLTLGEKAGLRQKELRESYPRVASVPFESEHKFMVTVHEEGGKRVLYLKGAPERLLRLCVSQVASDDGSRSEPLDVAFWNKQQAELSSKGLRVLGLCRAELPDNFDISALSAKAMLSYPPFLSMVLMIAILDPPRPEAIEAIKVAHQAGINVKMITGDHSLTAMAIGRMLGIVGDKSFVLTGPEVDRMNDDALKAIVKDCNVFARASPENKLRIVRALQDLKQTVAMTGDGVNDAPALKAADVGVAMGITGTDVSKEAAKMVLADDNFASIVAAVKEGRRVWDNIRKILVFNLPVNLAQGTSVLYAYILGLPAAPLTALQVLLVNLVTSVTLGLSLAVEPAEPDVMNRPPRRPNKRLVGKLLLWRCFFVCHLVVVLVIGMFYWAGQLSHSLPQARAEAFCVLVGAQVAYFVCCRFLKLSTFHPRVFRGNKFIYVSIPITVALMVFLTYTPGLNTFFAMQGMTGLQWARVAVCMAAVYIIVEVEKALVDPVLMPVIKPVFRFLEDHSPKWLTVDRPLKDRLSLSHLCGNPDALFRKHSVQRRGVKRRQKQSADSGVKAGVEVSGQRGVVGSGGPQVQERSEITVAVN